ncbi:hypothetical protein [Aquimarina sp. MMG016]|uniref:hypothetical protein n=1 Tax=Aquimarina sp. MMG016 TaxID=2822690 RepID=UPI001B3A7A48|nr:hypothetical protein [Aquimarina sp. MMG016]MBQ4821504.1 hypothetical protein [Aquimarina sp. MMG016]
MINSRKLFIVVLSILFTLIQISCNDDDSNSDCENAICTLVLIRFSVSITDQNQNPVALDSFEVIDTENGNDLTIILTPDQLLNAQQSGKYPLIQDGTLGVNQERQIQFNGFLNNQEVISSNYTVSTDCCHVNVDSGNLEITL